MLQIRAASPAELEDVLGVLDDAAAWLQSIGVTDQWPPSFSDDPVWVERFQRWLLEGHVFIARDEVSAAVGCFRLMPSDLHIWSDVGSAHFYLHTLAVRRTAAGQGVAERMLTGACEYAASQGAEELRLDCWAGNERLRRYYLDAGFEFRGESLVPGEADQLGFNRDYWVAKFARKAR